MSEFIIVGVQQLLMLLCVCRFCCGEVSVEEKNYTNFERGSLYIANCVSICFRYLNILAFFFTILQDVPWDVVTDSHKLLY